MVKKGNNSKGHTKAPKHSVVGGSKGQTPSTTPDDGFIVFTNSDKSPKPNKPNVLPQDHPSSSTEAPKRPDVKKLIGGASWTGKLPVNMLSEHCQKQNWEKPEYTICKTSEGFSAMVILKAKNSKTKELVTLPPFKLPPTHKHLAFKPSALEARHFAATYGLFRVCSMRNIHMMLPPDYRDLWKGDFEALKKEDIKGGRSWMYEADPFAAMKEREEAKASAEKTRIEKEKAFKNSKNSAPGSIASHHGSRQGLTTPYYSKIWTEVPKIEMGKRMRTNIEELVRKHAVWNSYGVNLSGPQKNIIVNELKNLGFRQSHVEEAVEECRDREETLEWLLIHVPEDDLPGWSLPEGYVAGISMASGDLKREAAIKRLAEAAYPPDLCRKIYDRTGDESKAAENLQLILLSSSRILDKASALAIETPPESSMLQWNEEMISLEAVFGGRFSQRDTEVCCIVLEPADYNSSAQPVLQVRKSRSYPDRVPVISIHATLPAYIRLSIVKQALNYATENLLGDHMLFYLIDWLEKNFQGIVENPGKLREVTVATSPISEIRTGYIKRQKVTRRPQPLVNIPNMRSRDDWVHRQKDPKLLQKVLLRKKLPAWEMKDIIVDSICSLQVTIISGETGSGKSTQCVQFILDEMYQRCMGECTKIICTQPRRISALGLADRVSEERCSTTGQEVGYIIKGESKISPNTKITFVTTGVLLRRLQTSGGSKDDVISSLADVSHIFIDEVHERSLDTDFLLVLLRDVMKKRADLKLVLMSATLDAGIFEDYFKDTCTVGRVEISGRTYPVEDFYLDDVIQMTGFGMRREDENRKREIIKKDARETEISNAIRLVGMRINYDLIAQLVESIDSELSRLKKDGGILIFMPGVAEINRTLDHLCQIPNLYVLPLHASLQSADQRRVFSRAPTGKRKIVIATNVAETSITIDDIIAVIDTGRVRETSYDAQNQIQKLEEVWASRAACKQRRGRAGRVQAGKCYKMFTRSLEANEMAERPAPEITRVPLEQLCLSVRAMGVKNVSEFLASALTPPESLAVHSAMEFLCRMGALDGDELTALGQYLSMIPADLRCGKLMVYGAIFGCLEACITIAAILTMKSPFVSPQDKREESKAARGRFAQNHGDLIGDLRAYEQWSEITNNGTMRYGQIKSWCSENYLCHQTLNDISSNRMQYRSSLCELSFIPSSASATASLRKNNNNNALIRSLCAGAFNPQIARIQFPDQKFAPSMSGAVKLDPEAKTIKYFNQENGRVFVHPSSTLFSAQNFPGNSVYLSYFNKMATSKVFIRDLTPFNAYTALLFSGPIVLDTLGRGLIIDGWLRMRGWARIGVLVSKLRGMLDKLLAQKIDEPELDLVGNEIVETALRLVEFDGMDQ
ncbi:unnamed protein product [Blumeria hordei]|uniref:Uncharacterized protein n=1 Tax=Blumeria hordei TaxID=2867405 RepID=A0A383V0G7_BLUHO|nr:unnamed protein product [Blumeria hordei]